MSYDTGGVLPEDIYGFGKSGQTYKMHEGETVEPVGSGGNMEVNVYANQQPEIKRQKKQGGGERLDII
ncbi:hypothetical protein G7L43_23245, partial [Shigella sonnei]|uniref:hypothetical protein n=1 Tax=Shigella sonnei TaxID=624 RepID=UPI0014940EC8|nr:hypothetical protein [Shigella sonnei]